MNSQTKVSFPTSYEREVEALMTRLPDDLFKLLRFTFAFFRAELGPPTGERSLLRQKNGIQRKGGAPRIEVRTRKLAGGHKQAHQHHVGARDSKAQPLRTDEPSELSHASGIIAQRLRHL